MFIALLLGGAGFAAMGAAATAGIVGLARSAVAPKRYFPKFNHGITAFR